RKGTRRKTLASKTRPPQVEFLETRETPAQYIWTGQSATAGFFQWNDPSNWIGGTPATDGSADLVFPAAPTGGSFLSNNNFAANVAFNSIDIQGGGYQITGNALLINGNTLTTGLTGVGVGIRDVGTSTLSPNITLGPIGAPSQTFLVNSGSLVVSGAI